MLHCINPTFEISHFSLWKFGYLVWRGQTVVSIRYVFLLATIQQSRVCARGAMGEFNLLALPHATWPSIWVLLWVVSMCSIIYCIRISMLYCMYNMYICIVARFPIEYVHTYIHRYACKILKIYNGPLIPTWKVM